MVKDTLDPPIAKTVPHTSVHHGYTLVDAYAWLQDKTDPEVMAYLEAENAYARALLAHTEPLQERLFAELRGRIKEDDLALRKCGGEGVPPHPRQGGAARPAGAVPYWDPAKWVAKLRAKKTDNNRLLLVTNMEAGHSGASGRYDHLHEDAQIYAFLIDTLGDGLRVQAEEG